MLYPLFEKEKFDSQYKKRGHTIFLTEYESTEVFKKLFEINSIFQQTKLLKNMRGNYFIGNNKHLNQFYSQNFRIKNIHIFLVPINKFRIIMKRCRNLKVFKKCQFQLPTVSVLRLIMFLNKTYFYNYDSQIHSN